MSHVVVPKGLLEHETGRVLKERAFDVHDRRSREHQVTMAGYSALYEQCRIVKGSEIRMGSPRSSASSGSAWPSGPW
jgi:hypothetical protein